MTTETELATCEAQRTLALKALGVLRHDVRNLLASVTIMADRMAKTDDPRLAAAAPQLVLGMEQTVALGVRAQELIEVLPGHPEPVPLAAAAIEALEAAGLETAAEVAGLVAYVDRSHLLRILAELLGNAVRAAGEGGSVSLGAKAGEGRVTLSVTDDGPGVPDYARADLLTPFKGMKRKGGAGLGLPIAAALARVNEGALAIERTGPGGTTVSLTLPSA